MAMTHQMSDDNDKGSARRPGRLAASALLLLVGGVAAVILTLFRLDTDVLPQDQSPHVVLDKLAHIEDVSVDTSAVEIVDRSSSPTSTPITVAAVEESSTQKPWLVTASPTSTPITVAAVEESSTQKPWLVLYVGLHKTGTTYLEEAFALKVIQDVTKRDNLEYLGTADPRDKRLIHHMPSAVFHDTMGPENMVVGYPEYTEIGERCPLILTDEFREHIREAQKRNVNALIMCEYLSHLCPQQIEVLAGFLAPDWRVKIILNYRALYSWFPSYQNQVNAKTLHHLWPDEGFHWEGGFPRGLYDLEDPRPLTSRIYQGIQRHGKHIAEIVYENYRRHFDEVEVLPVHVLPRTWGLSDESFLGFLFCRILETPKSCQAIESGEIQKPEVDENKAVDDKYSVLTDLAYENNLFSHELKRSYVEKRVWTSFKVLQDGQETPIRCMSNETMKQLELISLRAERRLFRNHPWAENATDAVRHHADFQRVWNNTRCHVDLTKLVFEPRWVEFFRQLGV